MCLVLLFKLKTMNSKQREIKQRMNSGEIPSVAEFRDNFTKEQLADYLNHWLIQMRACRELKETYKKELKKRNLLY
jgi:ABC-type amino acid transport substrate-binding protein